MKKKNLIIVSLLSILALTSCGHSFIDNLNSNSGNNRPSSENVPSSDSTTTVIYSFNDDANWTKKDSLIYNLEEQGGDKTYIVDENFPTYFYKDYSDVPYVDVEQFLTYFDSDYKENGDAFSYGSATMKINPDDDTITFSDYDRFVTYYASGLAVPMDLASMEYYNQYYGNKNSTVTNTYTPGKEVTFNLKDYHADIIEREGHMMVPFAYLNEIFCVPNGDAFAFNGTNYFQMNTPSAIYSESTSFFSIFHPFDRSGGYTLTNYGELIYEGEISSQPARGYGYFGDRTSSTPATTKTRSDGYASYFYYSTCFHFDYGYGKARGFDTDFNYESTDKLAEENGYKTTSKLLSTDPETADLAFAEFLGKYFDDGGHTGFTMTGTDVQLSDDGTEQWEKGLKASKDERYLGGYEIYQNLQTLRKQASTTKETVYFGPRQIPLTREVHNDETGAFIQGDVGVIRFDEFSSSTYNEFASYFRQFASNSAVKNVVIDLSMNGGGLISQLALTLSYLTSDGITLNYLNTASDSLSSETALYTKIADYSSQYNFYVLVSGFTFSAANAFAVYCKTNGIARIIGNEASGGGDCSVDNCVLADGTMFQDSSVHKMVNIKDGTRSSIDGGAAPDVRLAHESYYDLEKLAAAVDADAASK